MSCKEIVYIHFVILYDISLFTWNSTLWYLSCDCYFISCDILPKSQEFSSFRYLVWWDLGVLKVPEITRHNNKIYSRAFQLIALSHPFLVQGSVCIMAVFYLYSILVRGNVTLLYFWFALSIEFQATKKGLVLLYFMTRCWWMFYRTWQYSTASYRCFMNLPTNVWYWYVWYL